MEVNKPVKKKIKELTILTDALTMYIEKTRDAQLQDMALLLKDKVNGELDLLNQLLIRDENNI